MTFMVTYRVEGPPQGKGRPRFRSTGKFVQTYTPAKTKAYEDEIRDAARQAMGVSEPLEGPVKAYIMMAMPIPKSMSKADREKAILGNLKPIKKPDADNCAKAFLDAMNGIVYKDDAQIVRLRVGKVYGEYPCVQVIVMEDLE